MVRFGGCDALWGREAKGKRKDEKTLVVQYATRVRKRYLGGINLKGMKRKEKLG